MGVYTMDDPKEMLKAHIGNRRFLNMIDLLRKFEENKESVRLDMDTYFMEIDSRGEKLVSSAIATQDDFKCGSTCCAVGYAAHWDIGVVSPSGKFNYTIYSIVNLAPYHPMVYTDNDVVYKFKVWHYLFSSDNSNDVDGLINRLRNVVNLNIEALMPEFVMVGHL